MARKEIFGDELVDLLNSVGIRIPELDYSDEVDLAGAVLRGPPARTLAAEGNPAA